MTEQNFDSISRASSDLGNEQSQLSTFVQEYMAPAQGHVCQYKTGCEPEFLDMSENDPMSSQPDRNEQSSSENSSEEQLKRLFQNVDGDGNGQLNMDEMKRAFKGLDTNANGSIDAPELEQLLNLSKSSTVDEADATDEASTECDQCARPEDESQLEPTEEPSDHAPESAPEETGAPESPGSESHGSEPSEEQSHAEGEHASDHSSSESQNPFQQMLNAIDRNGDGKVTLEELFSYLDANHDGNISLEELQQFMSKLQKASEQGTSDSGQTPENSESPEGGEEQSAPENPEQPAPENPEQSAPESPEQSAPPSGSHESVPEESEPDSRPPDAEPEVLPSQPAPDGGSTKLIHIFPSSDSDWQKIISDSPQGSLIVSLPSSDVSWDNDAPFDSMDSALQRHIADAHDAGLKPLGYVGTRGGTRPISEVFAEIDSWYEHSDVQGIYLGASGKPDGSGYATDYESESYFKTIASYIKGRGGMAVINGGGTPNPGYMESFDVQNAAEGYGAPPAEAAWQANYSPDRFSAIQVGVQESDILQTENNIRSRHYGYLAVAPDFGVSAQASDSYWNRVVDALDGQIDGRRPN